MRVDETTKRFMENIAGSFSVDTLTTVITSLKDAVDESDRKIDLIKSKVDKLDRISETLDSQQEKDSYHAFPDTVETIRGLIEKESERTAAIESRVGEPISRIESLLSDVKKTADGLAAPTDDPDKKQAVVSDIVSAKAAILDLISGTSLSNKSSIEALPSAVETIRVLIEKESERTSAIESRVGEPISRIESLLSDVKKTADGLAAPTDDPDKKHAVVSDIVSAKSAILDLISGTSLSNKSSIEALLDGIADLKLKANSILDSTKEIVEQGRSSFDKIDNLLNRLLELQEENKKTQLRILYRMTPFWKTKERKSIKGLLQ